MLATLYFVSWLFGSSLACTSLSCMAIFRTHNEFSPRQTPLGQDFGKYISGHVGKAIVASVVKVGQPLVIDA